MQAKFIHKVVRMNYVRSFDGTVIKICLSTKPVLSNVHSSENKGYLKKCIFFCSIFANIGKKYIYCGNRYLKDTDVHNSDKIYCCSHTLQLQHLSPNFSQRMLRFQTFFLHSHHLCLFL